jgi:hypothetical protein
MMNPEASAEVTRILAKGADSVTDTDRAFLQARRDYLTPEQKLEFGLSEPEASATEDAPARKGKAVKTA